ncbi:MAG: MFS transporter [Planctomycetaceae bacterium]|nr:MFS transporter [Planctomycetaceae bacterium]
MAQPAFVAARLSIMMFIQFFIWGSWYVTGPRYLGTIGFGGTDFGLMYSVGPIAAILSPFFVGMIADRFFATERVLGILQIAGGAAMLVAASMMAGGSSPDTINYMFFAHMLCYMPTLALTNSLALNTMTDPEKQFPVIRVFGTIGWIAAGFALDLLGWGASIEMFYLAGGAAVLLGIFSFTLPHTPPPQAGKSVSARELLGLDAFVLLKNKSFLTFMVSSFLICIPLAFYYQMAERAAGAAGVENTPTKMAFGQVSEIVFMLLMPLFFKRLGVKWMLLVGMFAWVLRYVLFAFGTPSEMTAMILAGIILHGICYDFFFVTGQIYTDKFAPESIRSQAQGMLVLFTLGLGMLIGAQVAGQIETANTPKAATDLNTTVEEIGKQIGEAEAELAKLEGTDDNQDLSNRIKELKSEQQSTQIAALKAIDWKSIWIVPAVGAAVIMVLFGLLFKDDSSDSSKPESDSEGEKPAEQPAGE